MTSKGYEFDNADRAVLWKQSWHGQDRIYIKAAFRRKERIKALPNARFDGVEKAWHVPFTPLIWEDVKAALNGLALHTDDAVAGLEAAAVALSDAADAKVATELPDLPGTGGAWLHQRRAYHFVKELPAAGLFLDMGGGKSKVAVARVEQAEPKLTVIMCPKSVLGVWSKQFKLHASRRYDVWESSGTMTIAKKASSLLQWYLRPTGLPKVAVVSYDSCWRNGMQEALLKIKPEFIILDESHKIKAPGGKASIFSARLCRMAKNVLLLTGTPMPHGPEDIYAQYRAADPGIFGTSYQRFRSRYFNTRQIKNNVEIIDAKNPLKPDMADEFHRKVGSISIIVKRDEMGLDVPPRLPTLDRYIDLTPKTLRHYVQLEKEFITELRHGVYAVADNALTKLMRLRQLCSGFLKDDDGNIHAIGTEKQGLFADVLDDLPRGEPIVCFAAFHHDLDAIQDVANSAGRRYSELSGRRRDGLASDSTLPVDADVVGVQLQSGGVGIDFTRSRYGVYYSIDYNLGNIEQSFARLDRPGQQYPVSFIHLLTRLPTGGHTVDGVTYKAIEDRRDLIEATLEASRR